MDRGPSSITSPNYRGANGDIAAYAKHFIRGRISGFEKDMQICLTPAKLVTGITYAYLPALAACCGTLEYLSGLRNGNVLDPVGQQDIAAFARDFLPQPDFDREAIRILFKVFRHPIAHRGISSGVWVDPKPDMGSRRLTWKVLANSRKPACQVVKIDGVLKKDPPWDCPFTHRAEIHLDRFRIDLRYASERFIDAMRGSVRLQRKFRDCMEQLYPT
jgi:hypothetical protein